MPAVAVAGPAFVMTRSAEVCTVVLFLLRRLPLSTLFPYTTLFRSVFLTTVPSATEEGTFTWTVNESPRPLASPSSEEHTTEFASQSKRVSGLLTEKTVPAGRVSVTENPPVLSEGPLLVTESV